MNFGFTEEQELLRAEVRKFLEQNAPLEEVRKIVETEAGFDRNQWNRMAELGWVGLTMPESAGGMGLDFVTLLVLLEETGRTLFPSPLISTVLAAKRSSASAAPSSRRAGCPASPTARASATLALLEESDDLAPEGIALRGKRDGDETVSPARKRFVPDARRRRPLRRRVPHRRRRPKPSSPWRWSSAAPKGCRASPSPDDGSHQAPRAPRLRRRARRPTTRCSARRGQAWPAHRSG